MKKLTALGLLKSAQSVHGQITSNQVWILGFLLLANVSLIQKEKNWPESLNDVHTQQSATDTLYQV